MEDILEIYHRPYDPKFPLVCMDEQPVQLIGEVRIPIPATINHPERFDYEYKIKKNNVQRKSENSKLIGIKVRLYRLLLFMNVYCECVYRWI